jgi:osmotically-inducible protein OsmY
MKSSEAIQKDVIDELAWDPQVDSSSIGVTVRDGIVRLHGSVPSFAEKIAAEKACRRILGVDGIVDDLDVRFKPGFAVKDERIAKAAVDALKFNTLLPKDAVTITVDNGWVQLTGEVSWYYQKQAAENAVRYLPGVTSVTNAITVMQPVNKAEVKQKIEAAFKRSAQIDSEQVKVEATDGKVVLKGNVRNWAEKKAAEDAAWLAAGVTDVRNELKIDWPVTAGW